MNGAIRIGILVTVGGLLALTPRNPAQTQGAEACGPYALGFAFVRVAEPENPQAYVAGAIGVVRPSFRLPWLVTAYRHLAGQPLGAEARRALAGPAEPVAPAPSGTLFGTQRWLKARSEALKEPETSRHIPLAAYDPASGAYYDNCTDGAFEAAAKTLQDRVATLGAASPAVAAWVAAQDQVWANCSRDRASAAQIPAELPADLPAALSAALDASAQRQLRADRAYQIATAAFYAGQWDVAVARFRAIAADGASPWRPWGEYLAGRALLRKGTLGGAGGSLDHAALGEAAAAFATVAADRASPLRESAAGLVRFIDLRRRPDVLRAEVVAKLLAPAAGASFADDLDEYRYLFLRSEPATAAPPATARAAVDPVTEWIDTLRSESPDALAHAIGRWQAHRQTPAGTPWLVAAMLRLTPGHAEEVALVTAARAVPVTSPAYPSLAFHRARLLIREGKLDEARQLAGEMDEASAGWPPSAVNQLRAVQLRLATTFEAFLAAALQRPVGFASEDNSDVATIGTPAIASLSDDALDLVNERLPLSRLIDASGHAAWPAPLREQATLAALTRALLLDDLDAVRRLDARAREAAPDLAADLDAVRNAPTAEERRFVVTLLLARRPGLRPFLTSGQRRSTIDWSVAPPKVTPEPLAEPDGLRDNWWCALSSSPVSDGSQRSYQAYQPGMYARFGSRLDGVTAGLYDDPNVVPAASFLSSDDQGRAAREWQRLDAIDAAPDFFGREVLAWAATHPSDARVAEALHRVVRATRLGCTTDRSGDVSRQAFTLLHKRYAGSEWARRTPYWFR
jgi:hypothetical protein